ncbi:MAG: molybdopterin-dependent oxidoreductase [Planctomycetes bacterium]|nr:molybdopterin-dependent oxidoreductase [Planctomycetota bacterium]
MSDTQNKPRGDVAPSGEPWQFTELRSFPPPAKWDDWVEYDAQAWPRRVEKHYRIVPTICFNCEAACGLVAYIDKQTNAIRKLEGNPYHPGSRGRNCAKGPATLNQVQDPERILYPLRRDGPRGSGKWLRTSWDEVISTFATRIRKALKENRRTEVMYHVGRPGHDGYMDRVLQAWGVDGHNSHTNVCSGAARLGYVTWSGADRPSPDHAKAKFILLISSHLEAGHYFNPHAQRIIEGKMAGAKIATVDVRLSNTASMSDWWVAPHPGTEAALLLGFARVILSEGLEDREFLRDWVNWREWLAARHAQGEQTFEAFLALVRREYDLFTPEWVAGECGVDPEIVRTLGREIGRAKSAFASHVWRSAASGNEGGWQVARCLQFLGVLTGSVATEGGTGLAPSNKFVPAPFLKPGAQDVWNDLLYPKEWPLSHHELSFLLPHFLKAGRGRVDTYFTRVYNPVWTNPDGATWIEVLQDESLVGLHAALTPTWSETAIFADYVLPMGLGPERHDVMSQETHGGRWIGFRQPVLRVHAERDGRESRWTYETNPGEVWEEDEFWIRLSWEIDDDGSLGIRKWFESPYRPGECVTAEEYYRWMFENSVPGLPAAAAKEGLSPLEFMRRHGAFEVEADSYRKHEIATDVKDAAYDAPTASWRKDGHVVAIDVGGKPRAGFGTPSKRLEFWSPTLEEWVSPAASLPGYLKSHVHRDHIDETKGEYVLVPTFRLPTLIHTRSGNAKWLYELSNTNPVWISPGDAKRLGGIVTGDLVRVSTRIGFFVNKAWVTEGIRPGVVACSHHLGRWRVEGKPGTDRWAAPPVTVETTAEGRTFVRRVGSITPFDSSDPDSKRVWWRDGGVHQNMTFPVQPDPISGMHCWHQKVTVERARPGDRYGDVEVDTAKSFAVYEEWVARAQGHGHASGLRRPTWLPRAVKPSMKAYQSKP